MRRDRGRKTGVLRCSKTEKTKWKSLQATVKEQRENYLYIYFLDLYLHEAYAVQLVYCMVSVEGPAVAARVLCLCMHL